MQLIDGRAVEKWQLQRPGLSEEALGADVVYSMGIEGPLTLFGFQITIMVVSVEERELLHSPY